MEISERERWLMVEAFVAGYNVANGPDPTSARISDMARSWLSDIVADGVTVEMVLEKEADEQHRRLHPHPRINPGDYQPGAVAEPE